MANASMLSGRSRKLKHVMGASNSTLLGWLKIERAPST